MSCVEGFLCARPTYLPLATDIEEEHEELWLSSLNGVLDSFNAQRLIGISVMMCIPWYEVVVTIRPNKPMSSTVEYHYTSGYILD